MIRKHSWRACSCLGYVTLLLWLCLAEPVQADDPLDGFTDPEDGAIDLSQWLLDRRGFLPVPIVITEPAVGYGGGIAVAFFRESLGDAAAKAKGGHVTPPDIYGAAIAATENGTQFGGLGAMFTFDEDRWRYRGGIGRAEVHLDFYGVGGDLGTGDRKIGYTLDGWVSSQQVLRRVGATNHYLAARWIYLDLDSRFDTGQEQPVLSDHERARRASGIGLSWEHDSRDTIFTPSRGLLAAVETLFYDPSWGSDTSFETWRAYLFWYTPIGRSVVLGTRLDGRTARGDVPFYQLPYIELRGIPAVRYQDEYVGVAEVEARWNVTPRWAVIGFFGAGRAWGRRDDFDEADTEVAKGAGFRYLIARRLKLYAGLDYGWGPDDEAFYIQVGSAWR